MLKVFLGIVLLGIYIAGFALNEYFDSMSQIDKDRLEKHCVFMKSEAAKIEPDKHASEQAYLFEELKQKYPNLNFINPCGY